MGRKVCHLEKWIRLLKRCQSLLIPLLLRLYFLQRNRELLEFDFSTTLDGEVEDEATKIRATEDQLSDEQTVECEMAAEGWMATGELNIIQAAND